MYHTAKEKELGSRIVARQTTKVTHRYCSNYRDLGMERKKEKIQIPNNIFLGKKNDMMNVIQNTNAYLYSGNSKFKLLPPVWWRNHRSRNQFSFASVKGF